MSHRRQRHQSLRARARSPLRSPSTWRDRARSGPGPGGPMSVAPQDRSPRGLGGSGGGERAPDRSRATAHTWVLTSHERPLRHVRETPGSWQGALRCSAVCLSLRLPVSGQSGVWVVGCELVSSVVVDEAMVQEPFDGAALGSNVTQRVPGRDELWVVLIELVLETTERSTPLKRPGQASAGRIVADASAKSAMSWYQTYEGIGSMGMRSSSSISTGFSPSMPVSLVQNATWPVRGSSSQRCS